MIIFSGIVIPRPYLVDTLPSWCCCGRQCASSKQLTSTCK